ncbi:MULTISPECIES: hypothetical protein [unclassified Kitasatospora]|uniref:hypothetical protein n=1 Tax=unclassified Kitasatospora TaxID=2633591 RepID=UPI00070D9267|nr:MULTISPECIES: hypothetical protein [unclassified Kitasatospora]KQV18776.1 hypothetical protein ASC99_06185 [Kitasatospora sp. Root107]KRB74758.1 hypothetical protein ASE03_20120 [Kitasatospora sp. Root187]
MSSNEAELLLFASIKRGGLLIGRSLPQSIEDRIEQTLRQQPHVDAVLELITILYGPTPGPA